MPLPLLWTLLVFALSPVSSAANVGIERGVYVLNAGSFEAMIDKYQTVMVKFYAPWCGHCKALAPAYEKAARKLRKRAQDTEHGLRMAKVDATVEEDLAKTFEVTGFPTVLVFHHGKLFGEYNGGREKGDFINYMASMTVAWPIGSFWRAYMILNGVYSNLVEGFLPESLAPYHHYVDAAFPVVAFGPALLTLLGCVFFFKKADRADKQPEARSRPQEKTKRPAGRTSSPAPTKATLQGEEKATEEKKDPKDAVEKKED